VRCILSKIRKTCVASTREQGAEAANEPKPYIHAFDASMDVVLVPSDNTTASQLDQP
jgi:ligand-binding sensor protein